MSSPATVIAATSAPGSFERIGMKWTAIVRQRCPRCGEGKVFAGLFKMREACDVCETRFQREPGYFFGAMYFSYAIGIIVAAPTAIGMVLAGWSVWWITGVVTAELALFSPVLFRYSRVLWMHFDQRFDPR